MTIDDVPVEVRALLRDHVKNYEHLEVLLLLGRDKDREWTAEAVAGQLHVPAAMAAAALEELHEAQLLNRSSDSAGDHFACCPDSVDVVDSLIETYRINRMGVMSLMTAHALERVRSSALRTFAAAFLLGKKRDG